ncbi:MAG: hypothetical protein P1P88_23085 [Bacteroidales bacterium]|nr:hypothetical protein [Bacteroidales bacterium]
MAKGKKKLSEIKDALLTNTSFIKNEEQQINEPLPLSDHTVELDKSIFSKIKLLAGYYEKEPVDLINDAIAHYLRLKRLDIEEALKNIVVGDDDDEL